MKNSRLFFFPSVLFLIFSCAEQNSNIARKAIIRPKDPSHASMPMAGELLYKDELQSLSSATEIFSISNLSDTTLQGKNGTTIYVPATCLCKPDGSPLSGPAQIELKELFTKSDIVLHNKPTTSNRQLLVTGGAIYVNAKSGKEDLKISCPEGIQISIPGNRREEAMELFMGQINRQGEINWVKDSSLNMLDAQEEYYDAELNDLERQITLARGDSSVGKSVYLFSSNKFGWINCDAFYNDAREKVTMNVKIENGVPEDYTTRVFLVFKKLNSVMPLYSADNELFSSSDLPLGEEVYVVTLSGKAPKLFLDVRSAAIQKDHPEIVRLKESNKEEIKKQLELLN